MYYEPNRVIAAVQSILARGGWCVYEICTDVPAQQWEPRTLIFHREVQAVVCAIEAEIALQPEYDGRITGCDRGSLRVDPDMGAHLCYLAPAETLPAALPG